MASDAADWAGSVVVGVVPDLPARVLDEAVRYAGLFGVGLVVAYVDVTRFVTYEDPDGTPHTAPIDINIAGAADAVEKVRLQAAARLDRSEVRWTVRSLVGDPAMALKDLAEQLDAPLIVVGTRRRGLGETIREFFTGAVAARLAHRQRRPVLVVPLQDPVPDDVEEWPAKS
ncbi:MAG: universal stress protein [Microbacterium sp.]|uniref:universal stress protein n=1 Tax=Microbacterium sp. TaxID=51671 RepID=UPI0039E26368